MFKRMMMIHLCHDSSRRGCSTSSIIARGGRRRNLTFFVSSGNDDDNDDENKLKSLNDSSNGWRSLVSKLKHSIGNMEQKLKNRGDLEQLNSISKELEDPDVWSRDPKRASRLKKEESILRNRVQSLERIRDNVNANEELIQMALDEIKSKALKSDGYKMINECAQELREAEDEAKKLEISLVLDQPGDRNGCFIEVIAGMGGSEANDWSNMLMNMYLSWAQNKGFEASVIDSSPGAEAGIRNGMIQIKGEYAYGWLRSEAGVHRLVRISLYDTQKRRHTSFAQIAVFPDYDEDESEDEVIDIPASDLRIDTYRSSGKGGQHVNKTDSAVRITHIPTGFVVACQNQRSQHQNKEWAMKALKARLYGVKLQAKAAARAKFKENLGENTFGNQIRSYVLNPYQMIKDHRTNYEVKGNDVQAMLDGDPLVMSGFMESLLLNKEKDKNE